jgi:hypothetical protein
VLINTKDETLRTVGSIVLYYTDETNQSTKETIMSIANYNEMQRGIIYVMRQVNGVLVPLKIENQRHYGEWSGCFSAI